MNIYESICAIMSEGAVIEKNQKNAQQGFMYRGVDVVMNVFHPLLSKYHVFVVPEVIASQRDERTTKSGSNLIYSILTVKYTFYAEDGSHVEAIVQGEGMDSADKSSNKAMSVAFKYAMFQVFCIPTEEMKDPDAETPPESTPKEYKCDECGKPFETYTDKNGRVFQPKEIYQMVIKKNADGKARCADCRKKHEASVKSALDGKMKGE